MVDGGVKADPGTGGGGGGNSGGVAVGDGGGVAVGGGGGAAVGVGVAVGGGGVSVGAGVGVGFGGRWVGGGRWGVASVAVGGGVWVGGGGAGGVGVAQAATAQRRKPAIISSRAAVILGRVVILRIATVRRTFSSLLRCLYNRHSGESRDPAS